MDTRFQIWVGALMTLAILSYLYKENPIYRFAEFTIVSLRIGNTLANSWNNTLVPYTKTHLIQDGRWWFLILVPVGLMYYTRVVPGNKYGWLASYPISITLGWSLGYQIARGARSTLVQIADTMTSVHGFNELFFLFIWACVMMYFFFTLGSNTKPVRYGGKIGRYFMMILFGSAFGNIVQGRISLFLGRLEFLVTDWLRIGVR